MTTNTATIETLTAEVRVLMVGSRQVTLSVYRQLDRRPSDEIEPFGRVSDKNDEASGYRRRSIFVVGADATGALVRSEHSVAHDSPSRDKDHINRRVQDSRRSYANEQRQSVKPFAVEQRIEDRREAVGRRGSNSNGVWVWAESPIDHQLRVKVWEDGNSRYEEWKSLPLIVLAGLR